MTVPVEATGGTAAGEDLYERLSATREQHNKLLAVTKIGRHM